MKKILILISLLFGIIFTSVAKQKGAEITFETRQYDFGYIKEADGAVSCEFLFTNTGDKPLIIIDAHASCGCTNPKYPKRPIEPGKSGEIKVIYNPLGRPGPFKKDIKIRTNGKNKKVTLQIIGSVIPAKQNSEK